MGWLSDRLRYGFTEAQRHQSRSAEEYSRAVLDYERELTNLPLESAEPEASALLGSSPYLRVVGWDTPPQLEGRGLTTAQLLVLSRYRRIEALGSEPYIDASELGPYQWNALYLRLGQDSEHAHVVIRPGGEAVFIIADDEPPEGPPSQRFASVYHWILYLHKSEELLARSRPPAA